MSELEFILKEEANRIEKSFQTISEMFIRDKVSDEIFDEAYHAYEIHKAKKDLSKLTKIKKLIYRKGKLVFGTYYVNSGVVDEDKSKEGSAGILTNDVEQGQEVIIKTKKRTLQGTVNGFSFDKANKRHWISLFTEQGKIEWVEVDSIISLDGNNFPEEKPKYKVIKSLGGSTGALLVEDNYGNKFVKKKGKDKEHIRAEYMALKMYQYFGVKVPFVQEFDEEEGAIYTYYYDSMSPLGSNPIPDYVRQSVSTGFAVDALLGNWDVVGMDYDNILVNPYNGLVVRVDVGGSLNKRAQGENKEFGEEVTELDTLLNPDINPTAAKVFAGVNVQLAIKDAILKYDDNAKEFIMNDPHISSAMKMMIDKRVDYLRSRVTKSPPSSLNYDGKIFDLDPDYYDKDIVAFYDRLNEDLVVTEEDVASIEAHFGYDVIKSSVDDLRMQGDLAKEAIKLGMTDIELFVINDYTNSSTYVNDVVTKYTNAINGNINFDVQKLAVSSEPKFEDVEIVIKELPAEDWYDILLSAVKSLNHAKDEGKAAQGMNMEKFNAAKEVHSKINKYLQDHDELSDDELYATEALHEVWDNFKQSYLENKKVPVVEKSEHIKNYKETETKKELVVNKQGGIGEIKINGFNGLKPVRVAETKILCHALRKLENLRHPKYYKEGVFNRGINIHSNLDLFKKQHENVNQYVTHTWGSSSSWNSSGFGGNVSMKIIGKGVFINELSHFHDNGENEILNKPFSLYKTVMYEQKEYQTVVVLHKIA